jgi:hypothetical protein
MIHMPPDIQKEIDRMYGEARIISRRTLKGSPPVEGGTPRARPV